MSTLKPAESVSQSVSQSLTQSLTHSLTRSLIEIRFLFPQLQGAWYEFPYFNLEILKLYVGQRRSYIKLYLGYLLGDRQII